MTNILKNQTNKWEINSEKYLMIVKETRLINQLFNPVTKKCYIRRDVIFNKKIKYKSIKIIDY